MRPRTTLILFAIALLAAGFIFFYERRQPDTHERAALSRLLLNVPEEAIKKMEFTNAAGRVRLERQASGGWQLTAPVKDRADRDAVAEILKLASSTEVISRLEDEETAQKKELKELGLTAEKQARVVFYLEDGKSWSVTLGNAAAAEGSVYAQVQEGSAAPAGVLIARAGRASNLLGRSPSEWRDPRLVEALADDLTRVAFTVDGQTVAMERKQLDDDTTKNLVALWRITEPIAERADQKLLNDGLLPSLTQTRALAFTDKPATLADAPAAIITLWTPHGPKEGEQLKIYPDTAADTHAWAEVSGRPGVARVDAELLELRFATLDRVRDQMLTSLDLDTLTTIIIKDAEAGEIPLFKFRRQWFVNREPLVYEANEARVRGMVEALNQAYLMQFFDDPAPPEEYGLDAPFLEIVFGTAPHPSRTRFTLPSDHDSSTLQLGRRNNRFYARWKGRPNVYQFDGSALGDVPRHWLHYKSARLLSFSPLALRRLVISQDPHPPLELTCDLEQGAQWQAKRLDTDVTAYLDRRRLEQLISRLSELEANDWATDPSLGQEALNRPILRVELELQQFDAEPQTDDNIGAPRQATVVYSFAPTAPGQRTVLYYGRREGDEAVFIIGREVVEALATPVLNDKPTTSP